MQPPDLHHGGRPVDRGLLNLLAKATHCALYRLVALMLAPGVTLALVQRLVWRDGVLARMLRGT